MPFEKPSAKEATELATQVANLFSEYVSVRANTSASPYQGTDALEKKIDLDKKLYGKASDHVTLDFKAIDRDCKEAGVNNWTGTSAFTQSAHKRASNAAVLARRELTGKDQTIAVTPKYLESYVNQFNNYALYRSDKEPLKCATVLESKARLDKTVFGPKTINVADDYEAMGRDYQEAGNFGKAGAAYLQAREIYLQRKENIFAMLNGLQAAENYNKAGQYAVAEPLYRAGLSFYEKFENQHHRTGEAKQSSPQIRAELGRCLLRQRKLSEAETQLKQSLKDTMQGFENTNIIPQFAIPVLQDLSALSTLNNKPDEARKYAQMAKHAEARYNR